VIQVHVFYSGTVQGVGFRYTVRHFAAEQELTGWVRNLPDGRVEILVEGKKEDIDRLLERIADRFEGYVTDRTVRYGAPQGLPQGFNIVP